MFQLCILEQLPSSLSWNNAWVASLPHAAKTGWHALFPLCPDSCGKDMETWAKVVHSSWKSSDLYLLYRFNNPSCLQKVTFRSFWSDCFRSTGRLGSVSVNWLGWSDSFLYKVCGVLFQGASCNSLHAKFSINKKCWIQSTEVHLNAFCSLRVFGIEFMNVEIPCVVGLSLSRHLSYFL